MESKNSSLSEPEGGQSRAEAGRVLTPSEEDEEPCTWECLCRERLSAGLPGLPELGLATGWRSSGAAARAPGRLQEPVTGAQDSEAGLRTVRTGAAEPVPSYPVPQGAGCGAALGSHWPEGLRGPSPSASVYASFLLQGACIRVGVGDYSGNCTRRDGGCVGGRFGVR